MLASVGEFNSPLRVCNSISSQWRSPGCIQPDYTKAFNEGRAFRKQGLLREAARSFQKAAEIAEKTKSYSQVAEALVGKSGCEIRLFQYAVALHTTNKAKEFALKAKDHTFAGAADSNLAVVYTQLGDFSSARTPIFEAVKFLADSPRKDYYSSALAVQGGAEFGLHMSAEGTASYKQAIAVAKAAKLPQLEARESDDLGSWLIFDGDYAGAEAALTYAQKIFEALETTNTWPAPMSTSQNWNYEEADLISNAPRSTSTSPFRPKVRPLPVALNTSRFILAARFC